MSKYLTRWVVVALLLLLPAGLARAQEAPVDPEPHLQLKVRSSDPKARSNLGFGLVVLKDTVGKALNKRLTYSFDGESNNTAVRIDGKDHDFGSPAGKIIEADVKIPNGSRSTWAVGNIHVTQIVEIVPSQQPVEVTPGIHKRLLDTALIRFVIENKDSANHSVGMRIMVDTMIGGNDGVPFAAPNLKGLMTTRHDFAIAADVPAFVQALEFPDLLKPGTVGHMTLKLGGQIDPPSRVSLTRWPGFNFTRWEVPMVDLTGDSAVVIYWNADHELRPNQSRNLGFAYGLGRVSAGEGTGKLALTVNGTFTAGEPFTVTAYVQDPVKDEKLTLHASVGLERVDGRETEPVPQPGKDTKNTSVVTWKVKPAKAGQYTVKVSSSNGPSQSQPVTIHEAKIHGGDKKTDGDKKDGSEKKTDGAKKEDGKRDLTVLDARRALQMSVGNLAVEMTLDVDSDGRVTSLDAAIILQRVAEATRKGK